MAIEETITVSVSGIGDVDALADALERAAEAAAKLDEMAGKGFGAGSDAGAAKMADAYEAAFAKISSQFDDLEKRMADLGSASGAGDAGAGKLAESWDAAAEDMSASVDQMVADQGRLADATTAAAGKIADSSDTAAAAQGRLADGGKAVADSNAAVADSTNAAAAAQERQAAAADTTAVAQGRLRDSQGRFTAETLAGDDAMVQSAKARQGAQDEAAASSEKYHMLALGGAAALGYGIYKAAQLQTAVTRLYTSAGESQKNLPLISAGILAMSGQTDTSQAQLGQGAYMVESAGYHGKNALGVLKAVSEGAYAEGAPLGDVANAETSILNAYQMKPSQAMSVMNQMLTAVGQGKMTMAGLASALPAVLPTAAAAHISLPQVLGSLAAMTAMGTSPDEAAQEQRHTITALQKPSGVQSAEMQMLGIDPNQLSMSLGKQGLSGAITEVDDAIQKHMGPGGMVMLDTLNQSKLGAQAANEAIKQLPPTLQSVARGYLDGSVSAKQWYAVTGNQSGTSALEAARLKQFESEANTALGFSSMIKGGLGNKQTAAAALNEIMGGQVGAQTAMQLGGGHLGSTTTDINAVGSAAKKTGDNIQGWSEVQKTLNFQLGSFEKQAEAVATEAGQVALPAVTELMKGLGAVTGFLAANPALTKPLLETGGAFAAAAMLPKLASIGSTALASAGKVGSVLGIPGAEKLAGIGSGATPGAAAASSGLTGVASAADAAAGALNGVAGAGAKAAAGEDAVGAAGGKAALEEGTAGAEGAAGAGKAGAGAVLTTAAIGVILSKAIIDSVESKKNPAVLGSTNPNSAWNKWPTPGDHDNSIAGEVVSGWGKGTGLATEEQTPQFQSRFGVLPPPPPPGTAPSGATTASGAGATALRDMTQIDAAMKAGKPVKVPAPDLSALAGAKGQAAADANGITAAIAQAMGKPVKVAPPDLSALSAAKGTATAAGASVASGFAAGIASGQGAAAAAGASLANAATGAMMHTLDSRSPSKVTEKIGGDTGAGYAKGISGSKAAVDSAAASIGSDSVTSLIQGLQGGQDAMQAATTALAGAAANPDAVTTIQQTIASLTADIPAGKDSGLVRWLGQQQSKLSGLANKQGALEAEISNAGQLATSAIGGASITSAAGYTPALAASGPQAAQSIVTGMQQQMQDTQAFAGQLSQLQKMGLNATSLSQLAQAGTATGLPLAEGLAQGGKGGIAQLNAYESQIVKASQQIGTVGGTAMYQAGTAVTNGLAGGLKAELKDVDKDMAKIASQIVATVQKKLGTGAASSSGSTAASAGGTVSGAAASGTATGALSAGGDLGKIGSAAGGAASGLSSVASAAGGAASALSAVAGAAGGAAAAMGKAGSPAGGGGHAQASGGGYPAAGYGGGGAPAHVTNVTHVTMNVSGSVMTENDLVTSVQNGLLKKGNNNWQTGIIPSGRAS
jgi:hypothetical protein